MKFDYEKFIKDVKNCITATASLENKSIIVCNDKVTTSSGEEVDFIYPTDPVVKYRFFISDKANSLTDPHAGFKYNVFNILTISEPVSIRVDNITLPGNVNGTLNVQASAIDLFNHPNNRNAINYVSRVLNLSSPPKFWIYFTGKYDTFINTISYYRGNSYGKTLIALLKQKFHELHLKDVAEDKEPDPYVEEMVRNGWVNTLGKLLEYTDQYLLAEKIKLVFDDNKLHLISNDEGLIKTVDLTISKEFCTFIDIFEDYLSSLPGCKQPNQYALEAIELNEGIRLNVTGGNYIVDGNLRHEITTLVPMDNSTIVNYSEDTGKGEVKILTSTDEDWYKYRRIKEFIIEGTNLWDIFIHTFKKEVGQAITDYYRPKFLALFNIWKAQKILKGEIVEGYSEDEDEALIKGTNQYIKMVYNKVGAGSFCQDLVDVSFVTYTKTLNDPTELDYITISDNKDKVGIDVHDLTEFNELLTKVDEFIKRFHYYFNVF
jgi:hypothetical protein